MTKTVILGDRPRQMDELIKERQALGQDGYDEVWEGDYHMVPMARPWHGIVQAEVIHLLSAAAFPALVVTGPFNLGLDRTNFRVPDAGVFQTAPTDLYVPTALIVVEIISPNDETFDKFDFYWDREVEEILTVKEDHQVQWWIRRSAYRPYDRSEILGMNVEHLSDQIRWP